MTTWPATNNRPANPRYNTRQTTEFYPVPRNDELTRLQRTHNKRLKALNILLALILLAIFCAVGIMADFVYYASR
ncbi:hypothetical protein CHU67_00410 [Corynebacterium sp. LK19]|uniref:hypothetical protein n=1 Tax=Corynebacterium sp. LK19 TaxID=2022660 RepID=UPI0011CB3AA1|nr:hypothetical protein [Corynebacterium sp. LK19]TXS60888.1 hypothetical protein CHU67_00410 [Corynebacterium sp. LK19]